MAAAAYRAGEASEDRRRDESHDDTDKTDDVLAIAEGGDEALDVTAETIKGVAAKAPDAVLRTRDVKLLAPDGFTGYPDMLKLPESAGMYLTFAGLTQDELVKAGGAGVKLFEAYKAKYGKDPDGSYPLYGVAAMQVILAAIEKSDGARKGVTEAVLSGEGITIPADQSVVGKEIKIDPATADTNQLDMTIEVIKGNAETTLKGWPIEA